MIENRVPDFFDGETERSVDSPAPADGKAMEGREKGEVLLSGGLKGMREGHDRSGSSGMGGVPESWASEEEWNQFWKRAGRPDSPEGYSLPESWNAQDIAPEVASRVNAILAGDKTAFMQACHTCDLTDRQAKSLFNVLGNLLAQNVETEDSAPVEQVFAQIWPENTHKHLDAARRGARYAGLGDELDEAGLSSHPLVLKMAHALGEQVAEDVAPGGGMDSGFLPVGNRAREEMHRIVASEAYRKNDPEALRRVVALAGRIDT